MIPSTAAVLSKNIFWAWNLPRVLDDDRVELLASAVLELLRELGPYPAMRCSRAIDPCEPDREGRLDPGRERSV